MKLTKPELSSLELSSVVKELQVLSGGKIDQIYQSETSFIFQIHVSSQGKFLLNIEPGKLIHLSSSKPLMSEPGSLCMQLRKYLSGNFIISIEQLDSQRIVKLDFKDVILYLELFSKGNIVLCDKSNIILGLLEQQSWQSRELKTKIDYKAPPLEVNMFSITKKDFQNIITKSQKDKLVTCLATEISLGGLYAEEVCSRSGIDKNTAPKAAEKAIDNIWKAFSSVIEDSKHTKGYVYDSVISPIKLSQFSLFTKEFPSFNEALDAYLSKSKLEQEKEAKEQQFKAKLASLQRILDQQELKLKEFDHAIEEETKKADFIYQNYTAIKKLLDFVEKTKSEDGWKGVQEELSKLKKIKKIDLKNKKIVVDM